MPKDVIKLDSGLEITNVKPYFDYTGSYLSHFEATASREPTHAEMKQLEADHKIVCFTICNYPMGGAPTGWDEQNQRMAVREFSLPSPSKLIAFYFLFVSLFCIGVVVFGILGK